MRTIRQLNATPAIAQDVPPSPAPPRPAPAARPPWESPDLFLPRPAQPDYGYIADRRRVGCMREELVERCRAAWPHVDLVWTPEFPRLVPPAEVPWLLDAVRERTGRDLRYNLKNGLALLAIWAAIAATYSRKYPVALLAVVVLMLGVVPALQPAWGLWRLRRRPQEYPRELAATFRYQVWLGARRAVVTGLLAGCLCLVAAAQLYVGTRAFARAAGRPANAQMASNSMALTAQVAGLDKDAVRQGQAWRLLTAELMHGHPLHLLFNVMALMAVGRLLEVHGHPLYVPTVFLFSALCASALSFYLTPTTSVGASGGIMGLIGFLAVIGLRRRHVVPRGFLKSIALSIAFTAATGLVAYHFIDNAAHFGGLLGGAMLGAVYVGRRARDVRTDPATVHLAPSRLGRAAGWVSGAALAASAGATVWMLLSALAR